MDTIDELALASLLQNDAVFQTLLAECMTCEAAYKRICRKLSEEDRELLERYITLCEELEHRRLLVARNARP